MRIIKFRIKTQLTIIYDGCNTKSLLFEPANTVPKKTSRFTRFTFRIQTEVSRWLSNSQML